MNFNEMGSLLRNETPPLGFTEEESYSYARYLMRSILYAGFLGLIALFVVSAPKPASAVPAAAALNHAAGTASEVIPVRRWYKRRYYYRRPYYRPYGYYNRPYYRPYPYYGRPYYRPYARPYYWRRPGVGVYVGI